MKNKLVIYILGSGFIIFLYLVFVIMSFWNNSAKSSVPQEINIPPVVSITPVIKDGPGEAYHKKMIPIIKKELEDSQKSYNVTLLLNELPYTLVNSFSLDYDYENGAFVLTILNTNRTKAMEDYNSFLNSKNVVSKDMGEVIIK
jgi:hypothetical protein